jgi:alpha-tubulin suppressor-like RCC1 family protein
MRIAAVVFLIATACHKPAPAQNGVVCWGLGRSGQIGLPTPTDENPPTHVAGVDDAQKLYLGASSSCAVLASGAWSCWGDMKAAGQHDVPTPFTWIADVAELRTATLNGCARKTSGGVVCWGSNLRGELGNGSAPDPNAKIAIRADGADADRAAAGIAGGNSTTPVAVSGLTDATALAVAIDFSCALRKTGTVVCWGADEGGQLGDGRSGSSVQSDVPVPVVGLDHVTAIAAAGHAACAIAAGKVWCWGAMIDELEMVTSTTPHWDHPTAITNVTNASQIAMTATQGCAIDAAGAIQCWTGRGGATPFGLEHVAQLVAGPSHTCARLENGNVECWGNSFQGALGAEVTGGTAHVPIDHVIELAAGGLHTCAIRKAP